MSNNRNALLGAAFLMATSAIGPGFLTQTATFTQTLAASFGFVILLSILLDIGRSSIFGGSSPFQKRKHRTSRMRCYLGRAIFLPH